MIPHVTSLVYMPSDSREFQLCVKCRNIIEDEKDWAYCDHELIQMRALRTEGGIGIECVESGCHYNDIPVSTAALSDALNGHAAHHCTDENPDHVFHATLQTLGKL